MKNILALFLAFILFSCAPEDAIPTAPATSDFDVTTATLLKEGVIVGINHTASGKALVYESNGKKVVVLDPFSSQNGPDLKVYFSKDEKASEYLRLGSLKSTMGMQSYDIPGQVNIDDYKYVHIWCEKFTVVFAQADLMNK